MRKINKIIIHCSDTPEAKYFDSKDIKDWHLERGFNDIGYHYVILLDGTIEIGRSLKTSGAHARGVNSNSVGVCYIGGKNHNMTQVKDTRTDKQKESLGLLLKTLRKMFKDAEILGHYQAVDTDKLCPSFDACEEYKDI
jgi:N-acetylmuramoyl-L-alanine amidase